MELDLAWNQIPHRVRERFLQKIRWGTPDSCWLWSDALTAKGYGRIAWNDGRYRTLLAHRISYALFVGPIAGALTVDHLCHVRSCVNPRHLRLLTRSDNASDNGWLTRTSCVHGHEFSIENTYRAPDGRRFCRTCVRSRKARYRALLRDRSHHAAAVVSPDAVLNTPRKKL